jgi:hypothetical protein
MDAAGLAGSGQNNIPLGLLLQTGVPAVLSGSQRSAAGAVTAGTGGVPLTYVDCNNMEAAIANLSGDIGSLGWGTTTQVRGAARSTPELPGSAVSGFLWPKSIQDSNGIQEGPLGYRAVASPRPELTGFSANGVNNLHAIILGVWSQMIFGDWGLSEVIADNITGAANAEFKIFEHGYYDTNILHPQSFCINTSCLPQ